jgi:hypothetical protein
VTLSPPELLNATHRLADFDRGNPDLNNWLRKRALPNQDEGASRTYVVTDGQRIVGSLPHPRSPCPHRARASRRSGHVRNAKKATAGGQDDAPSRRANRKRCSFGGLTRSTSTGMAACSHIALSIGIIPHIG